jgi:multidrug resistance efflux pump
MSIQRADLRYIWAVAEMAHHTETAHEDFNKLAKYVREARAERAEALLDLKAFRVRAPKQ